ncbi:MAG: endopeptidase La [Pseudomonadota bacterium]|nr:endopeptidase La [Pseudomonadota bacterium]
MIANPFISEKTEFVTLPLRDAVLFPNMVVPLFIGRDKSIAALEHAVERDLDIFVVTQKDVGIEEPNQNDLHDIGTIAKVLQMLKLPDGTLKVLIEGNQRGQLESLIAGENKFILSEVSPINDDEFAQVQEGHLKKSDGSFVEVEVLLRALENQFSEYASLNEKLSTDIIASMRGLSYPGRLADLISIHLPLTIDQKQSILETVEIHARVELVLSFLQKEKEWLKVEKNIQKKVRDQIAEDQKRYFNREKLKAIQQELGEMEGEGNDVDNILSKIKKLKLSKDAYEKVESEVNKLNLMPPMSAEATVIRNWVDWVIDIPWQKKKATKISLEDAQKRLDAEHYGLEKVKERIVEYLAVLKKVKKVRGSIICLVGPPGVGKTSLGQSIANALGRSFVRISLGGVRDEAEIRGHRKTYIGAMPGRIIKAMKRAKVRNPLIMLDEIDKMGMDYRGDPASALLEVLDQEQNHSFNDHYLELDYDLSDVMFITTANSLDIPAPLLDRMEIIRIAGYTEKEKAKIAQKYLLPKCLSACGLKKNEIVFSESVIYEVIQRYTREAGVRELDRLLLTVCRKALKREMDNHKPIGKIDKNTIHDFLGVPKFDHGVVEEKNQIGLVRGLAWTQVGGDLLVIEAILLNGKGELIFTGSLGDVMKESIQTAKSVTRSLALKDNPKFYQDHDIHVHVPEGATPKDGPSAGITMCTAMVSVVTEQPIRSDVAMTGEITLRGDVLPIGGLKEKLLAAHRGGVKTVIIPKKNERDLKEIPKDILQGLEIKPVSKIAEVLEIALVKS